MARNRIYAIREDIATHLRGMDVGEGYTYDYGPVILGSDPALDRIQDPERPPLFVNWRGEVEQDQIAGGEMATARNRRFSIFSVTVPVRETIHTTDEGDPDHEAKAWEIEKDIHRALISGDSRARGSGGRMTTYHQHTGWEASSVGGLLELSFVVRWDHVSGDMTTE